MLLKYSVIINIVLMILVATLFYRYDRAVKQVEIVNLQCELTTAQSNNKIIKNNIIELHRIKTIQENQHKKFLEANNELIKKNQAITDNINAINVNNERLLSTAEESRSKAFTAAIVADTRTQALREYATIREELHDECKSALIEVSQDATRLQQKVLEFDTMWDIQAETLDSIINEKPATD